LSGFFLLCDPALLLPPDTDDQGRGVVFWQRLITWSADHRVRLGPTTLDLVLAEFGDLGWPSFEPPACPVALKRTARKSLNNLLARVQLARDDAEPIAAIPLLTPRHRRGKLIEEAIGHDAATLYMPALLGLATDLDYWEPVADTLGFDPPPPDLLPLVTDATQVLDRERDHAVAAFLHGRRIIIVGDKPQGDLVASISRQYELDVDQIRWIASEPGKRINLDSLSSLEPDTAVVVCIKGFIGHPKSESVEAKCRARGIIARSVWDRRELADALHDAYVVSGSCS
jgi:hypothetical protein